MPKTKKATNSVKKSQPDGEIQLHLWLPDGSSLMGSYQLYRVWGKPVVTTGPSFEPKKSRRPLSKKESEDLSALFG